MNTTIETEARVGEMASSNLLDEIMSNQSKIFVPSNLLKINRDGTLEETERFALYMEKKNNKVGV
jgi:hypothetical protein